MDRLIETPDGFDCIVDGQRFGTWRSKGEAQAGLQTEQTRLANRIKATGMWTDPNAPTAYYDATGNVSYTA